MIFAYSALRKSITLCFFPRKYDFVDMYMKVGGDTDGIIVYRGVDDQGSVPLSQIPGQ